MMDVDDPLRIAVHEIVRKNLHVARQNYEVRFVLSDQGLDSFLCLVLVVFGDGDDCVRNLVEIGERLIVGVVGDDQRNVAGEFTALVPIQKIDQTMVILGDKSN